MVFNLADDNERHCHEVIRGAHSGRWPTWRALTMVRVGSMRYEAAQWNPAQRSPRVYSVLMWNLGELGVSWKDQPNAIAARRAVQALAREAVANAGQSTRSKAPPSNGLAPVGSMIAS